MNPHPVIDYESAVSAYMGNLITMLRGFGPPEEAPFLETWVPDEDHVRSIAGIFEAAKEAGVRTITVRVGKETAATLDSDALRHLAAQMGDPDFCTAGPGMTLTLSFAGAEPFEHIHRAYRAGLQAAADLSAYEGKLDPEPGAVLVGASQGDLRLTALVGGERHLVKTARYSGASTALERGLMEKLCRIMEGKPILEVADHAVIEIEEQLRDHFETPPVPGVVMPQNGDPIFALPMGMVRELLAEYRRVASYTSRENFFVRTTTPRWRGLSHHERQAEITAELGRFPGSLGIRLLGLDGDRRVIVAVADEGGGNQGSVLLQLEHYLRRTIEPTLEIHLQAKGDLNTVRHIKGVPV